MPCRGSIHRAWLGPALYNVENKSLNLQCGSNAETLSLVDNDELVAFGITSQQSDQSMKASASGF
jgi:hypothetical protein